MTDILDETLKHWRQTRFAYGATDCLLSINDYIVACGGYDALAAFKGTYDTAEGAQAHLDAYGGPEGMIALFGLRPIDPADAARGDIVIIDPRGGDVLAGICTGEGIAARTERSVIEINKRFVTLTHAWRID